MKGYIFALALLTSILLYAAPETLYFNDCETCVNNQIEGMSRTCRPCSSHPYSGKQCIVMANHGVITGGGGIDPWLAVEPSQWYRLTVMSRNDMPTGVIRIGFSTSTTTSSKQVIWHGRYHKVLPCNSNEWRQYTFDLKTTPETRGLTFILRVDGSPEKQGAVYFDDIRIEKIDAPVNHLVLAPYEALVTFTDQPTMLASRPDPARTLNAWRTLKLEDTPADIHYDQLPEGSAITCLLQRGQTTVYHETRAVSGKGSASFAIPVTTFSQGVYRMSFTAICKGKTIASLERTLLRIPATAVCPPPFTPVKKSGAISGRQALGINGEFRPFVWACAFPDRLSPCYLSMDGIEDYLATARTQTGINVFSIIVRGQRPLWPDNPLGRKSLEDVADFYIQFFRKQMDTCAKLGYYATTTLHLGPEFKTDDALARCVVKGIKSHPALISYNYDEPECRKETPERMKEHYKVIKAEDPNHIVDINLCQPWKFMQYSGCSDTGAFDYYPFHGTDLLEWENFYLQMKKAVPDKPYISWLQYFNFEGEHIPGQAELTAQMRLAIILGQRILSIYAWSDPLSMESIVSNMETQSALKGLVAEYYALMAFIMQGRETALPFTLPDTLRAAAYQNGDEHCFIMVNPSSISTQTFTLPEKLQGVTDFLDSAWTYPPKHVFTLPPNGSLLLRQTHPIP